MKSIELPEFARGGIAAFINIWITYPVHKISFRQQIFKTSIVDTIRILSQEGIKHLYRGIPSPLLERTISISLMFGLYDQFYKFTNDKLTASILMSTMLISIMMPFRRIQGILQSPKYQVQYQNTFSALYKMRKHGLSEYYRGLPYFYTSSLVGSVMYFTSKDTILEYIPNNWDKGTKSFITGGVLGMFISTVIFPITAVKHMVVSEIGHVKFSVALNKAFRGSGIYTGLSMYVFRSMMSWSIITMVHDLLP